MAPKRLPLEEPPSASSSEEEEEESEEITDMEEDRKQQQNKENTESEEEEEEEEEGESEDEEKEDSKKPSVQKPIPTTTPQLQSPSDSEASDSEIRSGETQPSPTASDFTIKPIVSKPMDDSTRPKKSPAKPPALALKPAAKRPSENNGKELQKNKSKVSNGDEDEAVEEKKSAIHRLWSEDDEIVILNGMIDYQSNRGADPNADMGAFHEFIKKSLHVEVSKNQLMDKIRRLKAKYKNNVEKGEKGEDPVFSKPHDHKSFELSKKIWGGGANNSVEDGNAYKSTNKKARKSVKGNNSVHSAKDGQDIVLQEGLKVKEEGVDLKVDKDDFLFLYPRLKESLELESFSNVSISEPGKNFIKEMMSMIGSVKAKELEEKWKKLRVDEVALYLKRVELIREETKLALEAMKSSKP